MLLGRSVFRSVVDRLRAEADVAAPENADRAPFHRISGLNASFAAATAETEETRLRRSEWAYSDILADRPAPSPEDEAAMPAHLAILDPDAIAAELALDTAATVAELNDRRRLFARANHPDCVAAAFRDNATVRMTVANHLIDAAIRKRQT